MFCCKNYSVSFFPLLDFEMSLKTWESNMFLPSVYDGLFYGPTLQAKSRSTHQMRNYRRSCDFFKSTFRLDLQTNSSHSFVSWENNFADGFCSPITTFSVVFFNSTMTSYKGATVLKFVQSDLTAVHSH